MKTRVVILRSGAKAELSPTSCEALCNEFPLLGLVTHRKREYSIEAWKTDGCWREDNTEHPLDIVRGLFTTIETEGKASE